MSLAPNLEPDVPLCPSGFRLASSSSQFGTFYSMVRIKTLFQLPKAESNTSRLDLTTVIPLYLLTVCQDPDQIPSQPTVLLSIKEASGPACVS